MFDIDHFKSVNDRFGHDVGDQVLKTVARIAQEESDLIGRLGGEEFAVIIKDQSFYAAACAANRIREIIEQTTIIDGVNRIHVTSSFGVARFQEGDDVYTLLKRADQALYRSKNNGRNMITIDRSNDAKRSPYPQLFCSPVKADFRRLPSFLFPRFDPPPPQSPFQQSNNKKRTVMGPFFQLRILKRNA